MKKISMWSVATTTSLVSLIAMLTFDFILSIIYYFIGKVAFLSEIIDFIGGVLDLGLTFLIAALIASAVWGLGSSIIEKINGEPIEFNKIPIYNINNLFVFVFFGMLIYFGFKFFALIGDVITPYTADFQGINKILMFFKAIKDTFLYVRNENIIIYKIGTNSLVLFIINIYNIVINTDSKKQLESA